MKDFLKYNAWSLLLITFFVIFAVFNWDQIPNQIPTRFDIDGHPDEFQDRESYWWALPVLNLVCLVINTAFIRISAKGPHLSAALKSIGILNLGLTFMLMSIFAGILLEAMTGHLDVFSRLVFPGVGLFMIIIGNYLRRLKNEPLSRLRLPWIQNSRVLWQKSHSVSANIFFGLGVFVIISTVFNTPVWLPVASLLAAGILSFLFSIRYFIRVRTSQT